MRRRGLDPKWNTPEVIMSDPAQDVADAACKEYAGLRKDKDRRYVMSATEQGVYAEALLGTRIAKMGGFFGPAKSVEIERTEKEDDDLGVDLVVSLNETPIAIDVTAAQNPEILLKKVRNTVRGPAAMHRGVHAGKTLPRALIALELSQMYGVFETYAKVQRGEATLKDLREHPLATQIQAQLAEALSEQVKALERKGSSIPGYLADALGEVEKLPGFNAEITNEQLLAAYATMEAGGDIYTTT